MSDSPILPPDQPELPCAPQGLIAGLVDFLINLMIWWMTEIIVVLLLLVGFIIFFEASPVLPFIYAL